MKKALMHIDTVLEAPGFQKTSILYSKDGVHLRCWYRDER